MLDSDFINQLVCDFKSKQSEQGWENPANKEAEEIMREGELIFIIEPFSFDYFSPQISREDLYYETLLEIEKAADNAAY